MLSGTRTEHKYIHIDTSKNSSKQKDRNMILLF